MLTFNPFNVVPYIQPSEDACVATVIKTICDNQFDFKLSIRQINGILREKVYLGVGSSKIQRMRCYGVESKIVPKTLNSFIKKWKIQVNTKVDCNFKEVELLLNNGIYPYVYFPMNKLHYWNSPNGWKIKSNLDLEDDDVPFHCMILNGVDIDKGLIYGHDPEGHIQKNMLKDKQAYYYITKDLFFNGWKNYYYELGWLEKIKSENMLEKQTKIM